MWRLVIETGGESCQVGLMRGEEVRGGWRWEWPKRHAERLVWMVAEVLRVENLIWQQIAGIAVMIGPGSHTGLRVGLAAAKAWALRWGWQVYPVPLLRALYEVARHQTGLERGILTLWRSQGEEAYGRLWQSPSEEATGTIHPRTEWEKIEATLVVGNTPLGARWLYVPEVSWVAVGLASLRIQGLVEPDAMAGLAPLYFRPFIPTERKHGAVGSSAQGR